MKISQKELLLKAEQSLEAAKYLSEGKFYDFAVARAYYTMFYVASAFLAGENLAFSKHSAVISAFGKEFAKTEKLSRKFHEYLKEAQNLRHLGDYGNINVITMEEATLQITRAEEFLLMANMILESSLNQENNN
ncbi:HEPN domain-containing protein [Cyanobacterium aponinum FACHB-4101]|uniref:HEPN domain-containing protein n=1 Tax=Cyanobacterium aponinum TaxID=379064 RepID=UPI0016812173|nr:HEPN domain-containing protein [Cyanobacterium aponinum FACHB-4101]